MDVDPDSFVRGRQTLTTVFLFFFGGGGEGVAENDALNGVTLAD